jgi:hypothetical protein
MTLNGNPIPHFGRQERSPRREAHSLAQTQQDAIQAKPDAPPASWREGTPRPRGSTHRATP